MRHERWVRLFLTAVAIATFVCHWSPAQGSPATLGHRPILNVVVFLSGDVAIKRDGWTNYVPIVFGTFLQRGDLLKLGESSNLKIVCSDLSLHQVSPGISGVPCGAAPADFTWTDRSRLRPTRSAPNDGAYPVIIAPRRTALLSTTPLLRWTPVPGASWYKLTVRSSDFLSPPSWGVGADTSTVYPSWAPKLKPGPTYKLIVEVDGNGASSDAESRLGLGFTILDSGQRKVVEQEQRKIETLGLPPGPTQFLIANLYRAYGLESEAMQKLEEASRTFDPPAVARLQGECYLDVGLGQMAEKAFIQSLALPGSAADREGQMSAHFRLAQIYQQFSDHRDSAAQHLQAALALARSVGDTVAAGQAEKVLADLQAATQVKGNGNVAAKAQH